MDDSLTLLVHRGEGDENKRGSGSGEEGLHIKTLIPIWIQGFPDDAARVRLFRIHRDDCKRIWETKDFALG
jgi:hypothetical protein